MRAWKGQFERLPVLVFGCRLSPVQTDATLLTKNSQHCWVRHVTMLGVVASFCTGVALRFLILDVPTLIKALYNGHRQIPPSTREVWK